MQVSAGETEQVFRSKGLVWGMARKSQFVRFHRYYTWILAITIAAIILVFENDNPPRPLFSGLSSTARLLSLAATGILGVFLAVFWFGFGIPIPPVLAIVRLIMIGLAWPRLV